MSQARHIILTWLFFSVFSLAAWSFLRNDQLKMDELVHVRQIVELSRGNFAHDHALATMKGFHWLMSLVYRLTGSIAWLRLVNIGFGLLSVVVFTQCLKIVQPGHKISRIFQFAFLPILLPYSLMVYTDTLSLLLIMVGFWLCLSKRYFFGIAVLIVSLGVRQNNIIWMLAAPAFAWAFHNEHLYRQRLNVKPGDLVKFAKTIWPVFIGLAAFVAFVFHNNGISMGDRGAHPPFSIHAGNVFFFLLVYFIVFMPSVLGRSRENIVFAFRHRTIIAALVIVLIIYMTAFDNSHPYNNILQPGEHFLRNWILISIQKSLWIKLLFFAPMALAALDLVKSSLRQPILIPILLATMASIVPSWLIEQRYYLPAFFFLLLFLPCAGNRSERLNSVQSVIASSLAIYGIHTRLFYL